MSMFLKNSIDWLSMAVPYPFLRISGFVSTGSKNQCPQVVSIARSALTHSPLFSSTRTKCFGLGINFFKNTVYDDLVAIALAKLALNSYIVSE